MPLFLFSKIYQMSSQASIKHKIWSRPSKWKLEIINERLIFTPNDKDNETFTIKKLDIDLIDSQKTSWMYHEIRIISKDDKIYTIKKVPVSDAEKATQWIQEATKPSIEWKQDNEWPENRISIKPKKELTEEENMQGNNFILWTVTIVLVILWTSLWGFRSILTLAPCYAIRARETMATKDQKTLDRIKNRKNHKVRLISSSVWLLIWLLLVIRALTEWNPTIWVEWWDKQNIWTNTGFTLSLTLENIKELKINDQKVSFSGSNYRQTFDLSNQTGLTIELETVNDRKESNKTIVIERSLSEQELKVINDKKAEEEKKIMEEKRKQEEYEKSPEYKIKMQKEKIEKVIEQRKWELYIFCQKWVKQLLAFPETADFPWMDYNVRPFGEWIVIKSYVEYKNAYNVPLKSNFRCEYKEVEGTWTLVDAKLE